jgi:antitoxin component of RelBE/YafQ-DinJ toxin-antitoxin module
MMNNHTKLYDDHIHIKITKKVKEELYRIAKNRDMTASDLVRQYIRELISNENKL